MIRVEGLICSLKFFAMFLLMKLSELHESMRAVGVSP